MDKKILRCVYLVFISLFLSACGCIMVPSTDSKSLEEIFSKILIDDTRVLINKVDGDYDRMEMIDTSIKTNIRIHIIDHGSHLSEPMDYMINITPNWIYRTDTMKKTAHVFDVSIEEARFSLLATYTELYETTLFKNENLVALALSLQDPSFHRSGDLFVLKGKNPSVSNLPQDVNAMIEIRYRNDRLLEVHFRLEHDFLSTKQESNYISGTHWFFGESMEIEFPPYHFFTE